MLDVGVLKNIASDAIGNHAENKPGMRVPGEVLTAVNICLRTALTAAAVRLTFLMTCRYLVDTASFAPAAVADQLPPEDVVYTRSGPKLSVPPSIWVLLAVSFFSTSSWNCRVAIWLSILSSVATRVALSLLSSALWESLRVTVTEVMETAWASRDLVGSALAVVRNIWIREMIQLYMGSFQEKTD